MSDSLAFDEFVCIGRALLDSNYRKSMARIFNAYVDCDTAMRVYPERPVPTSYDELIALLRETHCFDQTEQYYQSVWLAFEHARRDIDNHRKPWGRA